MVPRTDSDKVHSRPFEIKASDVDVLVELNPDNKVNQFPTYLFISVIKWFEKQQTILTLGVLDLTVDNTDPQGQPQRFLDLTSPHSLVGTSVFFLQ